MVTSPVSGGGIVAFRSSTIGGAIGDTTNGAIGDTTNGAMGDTINGAMGDTINGAMGDTINGAMGDTINGASAEEECLAARVVAQPAALETWVPAGDRVTHVPSSARVTNGRVPP